jgi:hypothetical protein
MAFGTSIRIVWVKDPSNIVFNMRKMHDQVPAKCKRIMTEFSEEVEDYMKSNAPWQDQSGAARASLTAVVTGGGEQVPMEAGYDQGILLSQQWPARGRLYDVYLEGYLNLSILQPTYDYKFPEIMGKLSKAGHIFLEY